MLNYFSHISAQALVPEQLVAYVTAVARVRPLLCGECVAYDDAGGCRTLIAYRTGAMPGEDMEAAVDEAVSVALTDDVCKTLTVLGPVRPSSVPAGAICHEDFHMFLPLPLGDPGQNLRNMLRRGARECTVLEEAWLPEHGKLVQSYLVSRPLEIGTSHIFRHIPHYLAASPEAVLFAARDSSARLKALAIGDFSSLTTAFYMFAFRGRDCPPGVADNLLQAIVNRAHIKGYQFVNLGLGISKGIANFKGKWGGLFKLPCIQTSWNPDSPGKRKFFPAPAQAASALGDTLSDFVPPGRMQRFRRFFLGEKRPFDCLQIEVTSRCAGRCGYCPHTSKAGVWRSRDMEDKVFSALLPMIRRAKRVHLQGWGEPLLHPRFFDYAQAAVRVGAAVSTTTCGLALSQDIATKLIRSGIDILAFSLAGVDEKNDALRVGVPFASVCKSVAVLNRVKHALGVDKPRLHLAYLMLASAHGTVADLPQLMERLDVPMAVVSCLDYIARPDLAQEAYSPEERDKIGSALVVLRKAADRADFSGRNISYCLPDSVGHGECSERIATCLYIDAEGNIAPCIYLNLPTDEEDPRRCVFGNVLLQNPLDIWNSPAYADFRHNFAAGRPNFACVHCAKRFASLL